MASHPPAQVFPAPFLQQVAPIRTARIFNMPVICIPPGHQTMLTSALQPSQVANILPGQIPTTRGVVMAMGQTVLSPQQVVVSSSLPCSSTSPQEIRAVDVHKHPVPQGHMLPRELKRLTIESCDNVPIAVEKLPDDKAVSPVSAASHLKQKEVENNKDASNLSGKEREDFVETEVDSGEKGDNLNSSVITYIIESGDSPSEDEDDFDEMEETKQMDEEDSQRVKSLTTTAMPIFPNAATQMPANSSSSKVPVQYSNVIMPYGLVQNQIILSPTHLQQGSNVLQSSHALSGLTPAVYCQQVLVNQPSGGLPQQQPLRPISISSIKPILPGNENKAAGSTKVCAHCGTTETPLWRRTSEGRFICNACGIYWKTNSCPRPVPRANSKRPRTTKTRDACCANCGTTVTSLWRRDQEGQTVCNACGLYYKLHKESRPIKLKKDHIKTRKRRCRGEELDRNPALHNCHLPSNYSSLQSIATSQGSYVMMSSTPTRDQHSPTSDNSVAMVTPQSRPSMQQTPYTEV